MKNAKLAGFSQKRDDHSQVGRRCHVNKSLFIPHSTWWSNNIQWPSYWLICPFFNRIKNLVPSCPKWLKIISLPHFRAQHPSFHDSVCGRPSTVLAVRNRNVSSHSAYVRMPSCRAQGCGKWLWRIGSTVWDTGRLSNLPRCYFCHFVREEDGRFAILF